MKHLFLPLTAASMIVAALRILIPDERFKKAFEAFFGLLFCFAIITTFRGVIHDFPTIREEQATVAEREENTYSKEMLEAIEEELKASLQAHLSEKGMTAVIDRLAVVSKDNGNISVSHIILSSKADTETVTYLKQLFDGCEVIEK